MVSPLRKRASLVAWAVCLGGWSRNMADLVMVIVMMSVGAVGPFSASCLSICEEVFGDVLV